LKDGEHFDFREFKDAELFAKTSIPIPKVVERIKRMFKNIDIRGSKVVLLTARADFDDKDVFLSTFSNVGIPINNIYVERTGNMTSGSVAARKKQVIMKYLSTGKYRRVRLIDDDIHNLMTFLSLKDNLPQDLIDKVKSKYGVKDDETVAPIEFYALQVVDSMGKMKLVRSQVSENYSNIINIITALDIIRGCHNVHINEGVMDSVGSILNKIKGMIGGSELAKNVETEKGLLSYMKSAGIGGSQILYHAFNVFYHKNEESKDKIKELAKSVKKEHIIDILMKLDVLTLHLITGPLHVIEAVTGWSIMGAIKSKVEPVEKQAKQAVHSLESLGKSLDDKLKTQVQTYANAIRRVFGLGEFKKISETTCVGNVGYAGEELGAVGSFGGPDNLIGGDPEWMHPPAKKKMSLDSFFVISNQQDWDDFFSSFWSNGANTEQVDRDPGLSGFGESEKIKEETVAADVAVPDTLIGGKPGEAPSMVKRLEKKKKKRKSLEDLINNP
jgi:hypothetical protein